MSVPALVLLAALALPAAGQTDAEREAARVKAVAKHDLEGGNWNARVHAVHSLEAVGAEGIPLLARAADDADWQVRMTAVHFLGRMGEPALDALTASLEREPCRHVRLTALHWLGRMGAPAEAALKRALEDESRLVRVNNRYWLRKLKEEYPAPEPPGDGEMRTERIAAGSEDAKQCLASATPGHLSNPRKRQDTPVAQPEEAEAAASAEPEPSVSPPVPEKPAPKPLQKEARPTRDERLGVLDSILFDEPVPPQPEPARPAARTLAAPARSGPDLSLSDGLGLPEELAALERLQRREERLRAEAATGQTDRAGVAPDLLGRSTGPREGFPAGGAGLGREPDAPAEALLMTDAGTPVPEGDPVPALMVLLASKDARKRARAADELGKLGLRAAVAAYSLQLALRDADARVRASAALALGSLGASAETSVSGLVRALKDKSADVRASAALALARLPTDSARKAYLRHVPPESRAVIDRPAK